MAFYEIEETVYQSGRVLYVTSYKIECKKAPKVGEQRSFLTAPPIIKRITGVKKLSDD